ncbi:hypothetical protein [Haloarcula japonica]|uniref:hypothetical protein n=1 Tax=Haloarcula japonica TaxID=29282 RepID=UPI001267A702|nr:hypothetical protein [Haloarcula japonica]
MDSEGESVNADNVIGIDESGDSGSGYYVTVATRCSREADIDLVRNLIENELQPFKHKSSSIIRYSSLTPEGRAERASALLEDLRDTEITWAAIVSQSNPSKEEQAAAAAMAIKKSITHGLSTGAVSHGCGETVAVHDGVRDTYSDYSKDLRKQLSGCCDSSFQRSICPVYLTYLQEADLTYPQSTAADYIAGYIREKYADNEAVAHDWIYEFDQSWIDPGPQADPVYRLEEFSPVREAEVRSRVIAWLTGRGIPREPQPTGRDPYQNLIDEIENEIVYEYLMSLE